jgi:hypothetical protein
MMLPPAALPQSTAAADPSPPTDAAPPAGRPDGPPVSPAARVIKRLWLHESLRVFYDRLVDSADREWLLGQLRGSCRDRLGEEMDALLCHLVGKRADGAAGAGAVSSGRIGQEELRR